VFKRPPKSGHEGFWLQLLLWAFVLGCEAFAFLVWDAFGREKIAGGKRIAKEGLIERMSREL
jgi:CDP-diglyceride synthetase